MATEGPPSHAGSDPVLKLPFAKARDRRRDETRSVDSFDFNGVRYRISQTLRQTGPIERPTSFGDLIWVYKRNPVVYALVNMRARLFAEMTPKWRSTIDHHLFGDAGLLPLEMPWPGAGASALLHRMLLDVDLDGNFYGVLNAAGGVDRLRPDWVNILIDSPSGDPNAADARVVGYVYTPFGSDSGSTIYLPDEVCHWAPTPDPVFRYRGMSWIQSVMAEVCADDAMTEHVINYFKNGATVNLLVVLDADNPEDFNEGVATFKAAHEGGENAHGTLFLANGSSASPIGSNLSDVTFAPVQGKGETRIAAASGVPPSLAGLSEGLASTNYGSNFTASRRACADTLLRPLYRSACAALQTLLNVPDAAELWYDEAQIPFLQADLVDAANTRQADAATMSTLIVAGFTPESARDSVIAGDPSLLVHSGLVNVQLQEPGATASSPKTEIASAPQEEAVHA